MNSPSIQPGTVRFGPFTVNLRAEELWKDGIRVKLQIQPFQILAVLLERPNELVTREQLQRKVWSSDTFVDFDQGLNKAINKLRDALNDTADAPIYIETVPRRGYRFIAPVFAGPTPAPSPAPEPAATIPPPAPVAATRSLARTWGVASVVVAVVLLAVVAVLWNWRTPNVRSINSVAVMPLLADSAAGDYDVADGMTDSIMNSLSLVPKLTVISHASVFQYRGQNVDPRAIGQKLGVAAVLTGRVVQTGGNMSVNLE